MRMKLFVWAILLCCLGSALAQDTKCRNSVDPTHEDNCNGISVGAPKVFDNYHLTILLDSLTRQLQQQNNFIDQKSVMLALSNLQGLSTSEISTNLSVTGNPTPSRDISTEFKTGNVDANGNRLPNTLDRKTDTNQASLTPQAPAFDTLPGLPSGFNPTFGNSASDLLNDQVNLSYQIFNLQMILDRSLTDRLTGDGHTRRQAVLGFNVTLDPPRTANDAVAVVEVTVCRKSAPGCPSQPHQDNDGVSLVAMMPQEKTYNSAALSTKSNAFSGAAAVSAFQVGASARRRAQIFYVYRDTDTLSYERMTDDGKLVFGWMFRPVLGRRSVSPGLRQMFAVLALPSPDCTSRESGPDCAIFDLRTSVRTYWKKYDRGTMTSFAKGGENRAKKYWYGLTLHQAYPEILSNSGYENGPNYADVPVPSTSDYQSSLQPAVDSVEWRQTGAKTVVVSAKGNNFFTNTQISLGDKVYATPADGLILKSNQAFDIATTIDQLVNGPGAVVGRYGVSTPLIRTDMPVGLEPCGVEIENASTAHSIAGVLSMDITLQSRECGTQTPERASAVQAAEAILRQDEANFNAERVKRHNVAELRALNATNDAEVMERFQKAVNDAKLSVERARKNLGFSSLPTMSLSYGSRSLQTPIVSVNGSAVELPYDVVPRVFGVVERIIVHITFKESLLSDGGATVKVTWPFYNTDKWTTTLRYNSPARGFEVTRISEKSVVISRINNLAFVNDFTKRLISPEDDGDHCWRLIAGDLAVPLRTRACSCPPTDKRPTCEERKQKPTKESPVDPGNKSLDLGADMDYTVSATIDKMPSHAILLAPNGTAYRLDIPDLTDKKEPASKPIEMKQGDSTWISITLPLGKTASAIEINGKVLQHQQWRVDDKKKGDSKLSDKTPQTINVEIARDLSAKTGTLDLTVLDAKGPIATQKITITCSQCYEKGDK
jgi:hypothetical protein